MILFRLLIPWSFRGKPRFRLVELCRLICSYEPHAIDHGVYNVDASSGSVGTASKILEMAEYRAVVAESGRIGYQKSAYCIPRAQGKILRPGLQRRDPVLGQLLLPSLPRPQRACLVGAVLSPKKAAVQKCHNLCLEQDCITAKWVDSAGIDPL